MHDRTIAWMMSGGNRYETPEERLDRVHALRVARAEIPATPSTSATLSLRSTAMTALATIGIGSATNDRCVAC